ncbi:saccharopine dehydrogenase NADP-binding domain-containing protein [Roseomonas sp. HJA6]|uniref:Saccharopine dehydrogenase NADP-binding domain-containing protein n=1 Tax=Roseomonas alba TaxID=2846776 RepID=A0ABS7AF03_9PROT|nr:saccharopine dehydrogenase C-terminal domain-containing protein [Neoroseomonas alba]MBW6400891.1 saccharopine dehydrogenase NADP-binding domain-containing protein [Neoroseomonas alba]
MKHAAFDGRLVMLGFGSIGQGVLPLILRHIDMPKDRIEIVTSDDRGASIAAEYGIAHSVLPLTRDNYETVLRGKLSQGDFLLNLSVDVSSVALIMLCREIGALYLDTCIEPWLGGYTDPSLSPSQRSNYALRESALALKTGTGPTAVTTHGANPGLVSHFVKQALLDIARDTGRDATAPTTREGWAKLAADLGVKVIHIAERDTQVAAGQPKKRGEFVNTWSIDGFTGEGCQPAELGWGSHEKALPVDGMRHEFGCDAAIYLMRPGASTRVRSWTPLEGPMHSFLITHNESISLADYYTLRDASGAVVYRPTAHYAYHPCDDAVLSVHEFAGRNWELQSEKRLMMEEITSGMDELGVLLMGHEKGAYWYGSRLTIEEARKLCPHNNATSLQVCVAVLAGMVHAIENPNAGVLEADELDHARALEICFPYLGEMAGVYSDWTPLQDRGQLFPEEVDADCPWQFTNFRVS